MNQQKPEQLLPPRTSVNPFIAVAIAIAALLLLSWLFRDGPSGWAKVRKLNRVAVEMRGIRWGNEDYFQRQTDYPKEGEREADAPLYPKPVPLASRYPDAGELAKFGLSELHTIDPSDISREATKYYTEIPGSLVRPKTIRGTNNAAYFEDPFSPLKPKAPYLYIQTSTFDWYLISAGPDGDYDVDLDKLARLVGEAKTLYDAWILTDRSDQRRPPDPRQETWEKIKGVLSVAALPACPDWSRRRSDEAKGDGDIIYTARGRANSAMCGWQGYQ